MEVAPLIHSRTGQCDYNPKFAVRPKDFSEIQWARSKILAATRNIDRFNGISRIVAAKNGVCIAGIVCTMKFFVNNCLTSADKDAAQPYIDVHGRLYGVFLGYAFKGNGNEIPIVSDSDLWKWFKEYLTPEWEILLILLIILGAIAYWWTHKQENDLELHLSLENHTQLFCLEYT